jgi:thiamine-phosphate pyrophosphorylase
MMLHLVTDRRRLAPGADDPAATACLIEQVRFAVAAEIDVVQVRERDLESRALSVLVSRLVDVARGSRTRLVVNDRLDVALASGADGVHLRADSVEASRIRPHVPPGFLIGRSVHSAEEGQTVGPVDYVIAGTVWPTSSKGEGHAVLGLDGLKAIVDAVDVPVLAIGGVRPDRAAALAEAGAAGLAAIGAWMDEGAERRAVSLHDAARAFRAAFQAANMDGLSR